MALYAPLYHNVISSKRLLLLQPMEIDSITERTFGLRTYVMAKKIFPLRRD
jgi:hypothetical protein